MALFKSEEEKRLIELQNILYGMKSRRLLKTPEQIRQDAVKYAEYQASLADAAAQKVEAAADPKTLFDNVDKGRIVLARIKKVAELDPGLLPWVAGMEEKSEYDLKEPLAEAIDNMIDRCWKTYKSQALMYNSEKQRDKQINRFFVLMDVYKDKMFPRNLEHLEYLRNNWNNYEA